jgi:hypothetical protein
LGVRQIQYCYEPAKKWILHRVFPHRDSPGKPGEKRESKTKGLQPLEGLNAKAAKEAEKDNHRAKAPVKKRMNALDRVINRGICCTPYLILCFRVLVEKNNLSERP